MPNSTFELAQANLAEARKVREAVVRRWADASNEGRTLSTSEAAKVRELSDRAAALEAAAESRFAEAARIDRFAAASVGPNPTTHSTVYSRGEVSFVRDTVAAARGDSRAAARLAEHDEFRRAAIESEGRSLYDYSGAGSFLPTIGPDRAGYSLAPTTGRVYLDAIDPAVLPPDGDAVSFPSFGSAFEAAAQTAQGSAVAESTPTITNGTAAVVTIAASTKASVQVLERSTPAFDAVLLRGLTDGYHAQADRDAIAGTGSPTLTGPLSLGTAQGVGVVTAGTGLTGQLFVEDVAAAVAKVSEGVYDSPDRVFVHPRRVAWLASRKAADDSPLVQAFQPAAGALPETVGRPGYVGTLLGVPLFSAPSVPVTFGTANNEDAVLVMSRSAVAAWQASREPQRLAVDVDPSTMVATLTTYGYVAQAIVRPAGIAIVTGPGLANPFV